VLVLCYMLWLSVRSVQYVVQCVEYVKASDTFRQLCLRLAVHTCVRYSQLGGCVNQKLPSHTATIFSASHITYHISHCIQSASLACVRPADSRGPVVRSRTHQAAAAQEQHPHH